MSETPLQAAILGAGPYGLSLAAHLDEAGIRYRIFGQPMQSWKTQMPAGMKLKSDGFASSLSAGNARSWTLEEYCREFNRPYHATQLPVAVEDFADYGEEFSRRFVAQLEMQDVASVERQGKVYRLELQSGKLYFAENVILATGVSLFAYLPLQFAALPRDRVSHTSDHRHFECFAGKQVVVLGRGASSLNAAVLLHEAGAKATLVSRHPRINVHAPSSGKPRPVLQKLMHPSSPLGGSMRSWLSSSFPGIFRVLPAWLRRIAVYKHLGPAGGTALFGRMHFPTLLGWRVTDVKLLPNAETGGEQLCVSLADDAGETQEIFADHLIAGTGYRADLARMSFLSESIRSGIRSLKGGAPHLSRSFESTVAGLYFSGPVAAPSFGPLLRFAHGAGYAAARITRRLKRQSGLA